MMFDCFGICVGWVATDEFLTVLEWLLGEETLPDLPYLPLVP